MELSATVDAEKAAEVFARINSEGVQLNQADFILTLMSVFWDKGRKQLEDFSRTAVESGELLVIGSASMRSAFDEERTKPPFDELEVRLRPSEP